MSELAAAEIEALRRELAKSEIREALHRYCRGVDRGDAELIRSAYHEDGIDHHGAWEGPGAEFAALITETLHADQVGAAHSLFQIVIELEGEVARVESYFLAGFRNRDDEEVASLFAGRYLDRFERRRGRWGIARRTVVRDWSVSDRLAADLAPRVRDFLSGRPDRGDPLFQARTWDPPVARSRRSA